MANTSIRPHIRAVALSGPALLATFTVLAACGERRDAEPVRDSVAAAPAAASTPSVATSSAEDAPMMAIRTTDGNVEMALRADRVQVGLSEKVLGEVRGKLASDTAAGGGGALGGMIKGIVSSTVQNALATRMDFPLDEIEELSYDGERLHLVMRGKGEQLEHTEVNKRPLLESFAPEDARRFVEAVRAAKARGAEAR